MSDQIEQTLTATVAAAGFAVKAVAPAPNADERLAHGSYWLVDCDDEIYRLRDPGKLDEHMDDETGAFKSYVVGVYEVTNGVMKPLDMLGLENDYRQEIADSKSDLRSLFSGMYR